MTKQQGVCIKLDNDVMLSGDSFSWTLSGKNQRNSYHTTLESALIEYLDSNLRSSDAKTIGELIKQQKIIATSLKTTLTTLKLDTTAIPKIVDKTSG